MLRSQHEELTHGLGTPNDDEPTLHHIIADELAEPADIDDAGDGEQPAPEQPQPHRAEPPRGGQGRTGEDGVEGGGGAQDHPPARAMMVFNISKLLHYKRYAI